MLKLLGLNSRMVVGAAIGLSVGTIFFVAYKQHCAAEKYKTHREEYCSSMAATAEQKKSCVEEGQNARDYLPWGYILISWPEGITTWAILATLGGIFWQAVATQAAAQGAKDAAGAAKVQIDALKSKERARLALHPGQLEFIDLDDPFQCLTIDAENVGYSHAFNVGMAARCEITMSNSEPSPAEVKDVGTVNIIRAQEIIRRYRDDEERPEFNVLITAAEEMWKNVIHSGATDLYAHLWGIAMYEDVFGDSHKIGFQYRLKIHSLGNAVLPDTGTKLPISSKSAWIKCEHQEHNHED
jgi:hypothetical protein